MPPQLPLTKLRPIAGFRSWLRGALAKLALERQVHVEVKATATGDKTQVRIDHRIPAGDGHEGWRITTKEQFLPSAHFGKKAREALNSASLVRGRRVYCIDLGSQEVIAALAYHLDDSGRLPLLITAIGLRLDADGSAALFDQSRAAALVVKQYLHVVATKTDRGAYVDYDHGAGANDDLVDLGFQRGPKVKGFKPSGTLWRQPPLGG